MKDGLEKRMAEELCKVANHRFNYMYALRELLLLAEVPAFQIPTMIERARNTGSTREKK
jgi:hypothetical protein